MEINQITKQNEAENSLVSLKNKKMDDTLMDIPNEDKQNYPYFR